jgi:putative DNA primase/helicase
MPTSTRPKVDVDALKARLPLSSLIGETEVFDKRKSNPARGVYWAPCPFHGERTSSFEVEDRKALFHCFGCGAGGDHVTWLEMRFGVTFWEAVEKLGGVPEGPVTYRTVSPPQKLLEPPTTARRIWRQSDPIGGTSSEKYLIGRGLDLRNWPDEVLRSHPGIEWTPGSRWGEYEDGAPKKLEDGPFFPGLIGLVQQPDGTASALWRIYHTNDGQKARVDNPKLGLGPVGAGAIRLGGISPTIGVAEGVETALAISQLIEHEFPVWSVMSTSGMRTFVPPEGVKQVRIFVDGDKAWDRWLKPRNPPGQAAAEALNNRIKNMVECWIEPPPSLQDYLDILNKLRGAHV